MREALDRLAPALSSSDLTFRNGRGDADFVAALGYASRHYPIASPLIRMYLNGDKTAVHEARRRAYEMAKKAALRNRALLGVADLVNIGKQALAYAVNKTCPRCHGTKYELIPGTTCLGSEPCRECGGDGRRRLPRRHRRIITEVVAQIERVESNIEAIVGRRV